jgi:steroid 5-alpha reductase family enzyme
VTFVATAAIGLAAVVTFMTLVWLASVRIRNASIVDIFWGIGFLLTGLTYFALTDGLLGRKVLVLALVAVWSLRLSGYIASRNLGHGEDYRYRTWRERSPRSFWWISYFQVFLLQGLLLWVISFPLLVAMHSDEPDRLTFVDAIGALLWAIGFLFEAVGDYQLSRFKANPTNKGKVMRSGLWRYTRHPNYFGDATLWWGFFVIAAGVPWGWTTVFAPVLMTVLLLRVSGVALLERTITKRRPEYADYAETTSAFFPWLPKRRPTA